ncbi:MAG: aminoacyl-tRNA hydrolase [Clostridiales bacterium]|nr:aminoacyl-tRNA hydrolase [Clostridiales bacterium]
MYLVVGLGNPEKKYFNTFHNMGFMVVDRLVEKLGVEFNKGECRAVTAHARVNGEKVIVAKPVTYMNLSGEAVQELCHRYKIEKGHLIVVYDDVDIPIGNLRIRVNGSAGTHNGMKNIVQMLSTDDFPRVRVGIGKETPMPLIDFVLSQVTDDDHTALDPVLDAAASALYDFVNGADIDKVMQKYNLRA